MRNREEYNKYMREWRAKNKDKVKTINHKCYSNNKEVRNAESTKWNSEHRDIANASIKKWKQKNPHKNRAYSSKRRLAKMNRIPKWTDLKVIEEFYKNCPKGYHVDHIIPLQGKIVSGLHVINNLQYLLATENLKKHNKFIEVK